jgi:hypothetical protein
MAMAPRAPIASPAGAAPIFSTMLGITQLIDEITRELGRPNVADAALRQTVGYWDRLVLMDPLVAGPHAANEQIANYRRRIEELDQAGRKAGRGITDS